MSSVHVTLEFTPNPNTLKYVVDQVLLERGAANFTSKQSAEGKSILATTLLGIEGVSAIMIGRNFVTVTKNEEGEWEKIHMSSVDTIKAILAGTEPAVNPEALLAPINHTAATGDVEKRIQEILDQEIRPAVAMDGGDITFDKYEDGVVYLFMQGACSGCPSSTMTLKMGIETRLRELIPEIKEVVAI